MEKFWSYNVAEEDVEYGGNSKERNADLGGDGWERTHRGAVSADMLQTWIKLWGKKKAVGLGGRNLEEQNQTTARSTTAWILGEWGREITGK